MAEKTLNLRGLKCPLPALRTRKALSGMRADDILIVECTDPLAAIDIPNLLRQTGDVLEDTSRATKVMTFRIRKRATQIGMKNDMILSNKDVEQLLTMPESSVDPSWHEFFADYQPADAGVAVGVTDGRTDPPVAAPPRHQQQVEKVAAADPAGAKRGLFTRTRPSEKPVVGSASKATSSGLAAGLRQSRDER